MIILIATAPALAVLAVGYLRCDGALELLEGVLSVDPSEEVRTYARARERPNESSIPVFVPSRCVRYITCA